jgi:hypothetical protein
MSICLSLFSPRSVLEGGGESFGIPESRIGQIALTLYARQRELLISMVDILSSEQGEESSPSFPIHCSPIEPVREAGCGMFTALRVHV